MKTTHFLHQSFYNNVALCVKNNLSGNYNLGGVGQEPNNHIIVW